MLVMLIIRLRFILLAGILLSACVSCSSISSFFSGGNTEPSRIKAPAKEAIVNELVVSRSDLKIALGDELKTAQLRAVEVFQNASGAPQTFPSFRLFDIQDGSVYSLLGLKNVDILVAINERVVVAPQVLGQIVRLLPDEKGVTFEVIRAGKSMLLKVRFS